jgi:hypothetical protein
VVVLALIAVVALHRNRSWAIGMTWTAHVVGLADATFNGINAARLQVAAHLGGAWYVVAFAVPLMMVAHVLAFRRLLRRVAE